MPQKVLDGRSEKPDPRQASIRVKVDQVALCQQPGATLDLLRARNPKRCRVESAVAYETHCVRLATGTQSTNGEPEDALRFGLRLGRAGVGFPGHVHLERFAAPGRLALTDDIRLASLGAVGMLTLLASPGQLAEALCEGHVRVRAPKSLLVLLSGKLRPFSSAKDAAVELMHRGLGDVVRRIDNETGAPVVLEFGGPSARLMSVPERAVLCGLAPALGAAAAIFPSDAKTEAFLRDQRRSKAHRALAPDPGAPCEAVFALDLAEVEPLLLEGDGVVRSPRQVVGEPVKQVIVGGDSGTALHDLLVVAALLKSKKLPANLEFLIAPPSRQVLDALGRSGALVDLFAVGARLVEPDRRLLSQELYPPASTERSMRGFDSTLGAVTQPRTVVASAYTLAVTAANGAIADPRALKRPAKVSVPRVVPTEDVLMVRREKAKKSDPKETGPVGANSLPAFEGCLELSIREGTTGSLAGDKGNDGPTVVLARSVPEASFVASRAPEISPGVRALISPELPRSLVPRLSGAGVVALTCSPAQYRELARAKSLKLARLNAASGQVEVTVGKQRMTLPWLAIEEERFWVLSGRVATVAEPA